MGVSPKVVVNTLLKVIEEKSNKVDIDVGEL